MIALRALGIALSVALFSSAVLRFRRRKITRLNLLISSTIATAIGLVAGLPGLFDPVFELFNFQRGGGGRLLAVLLFANVVLLLLVLRNTSEADRVARDFRLLMEALGRDSFDWAQEESLPAGERVVVCLPAHNEAGNVGDVIRGLPEKIDGHPVIPLVIDDASEDETSPEAQEAGALVARLPVRRGGGLALRVGYEIALRLGAVIVASMDADGQHVPEELPTVLDPILKGEADMVQGSRMLGSFEQESRVRRLGVLFFSRVVSFMTGVRVTDVSNGYRAARVDTLRKLILQQDQFWTSEILIEGLRQRARIVEVPITVRARASGETKKPGSLKYGWQFAKAIVQTWLR